MAHITLSLPDETYAVMKKNPEINWSEVARQNIIAKALDLTKTIYAHDLLKQLPEQIQKSILVTNEQRAIGFANGVREKGWKRRKYLTQA